MQQIRFLLLLMGLLSLGLFAPSAYAQSKSVVVERRDADMTLNADGTVDVLETWVVNFQGGPFHFAFRSIPFNRISGLEFLGVSQDETAYTREGTERAQTYRVDIDGDGRTIYWYFEPTTNATRTFALRYRLHDALRIYDGGDQFWWKFVESDRGYPIQAARVIVHLPSEFATDQIIATTYENFNETFGARVVNGRTVEFSGGPFADGVEWEIRVQFPHGVVTQSKQAWQATDDARVAQQELHAQLVQRFTFYSLLATVVLAVGGGLGLLLLWFVVGRDSAVTLPAEFLNTPPDTPAGSGQVLTPALAGTLIDEEANVRDVLATLIDWAQRGVIRIRAVPQGAKTADPNDDFVFEKIANAPPLAHQYERELIRLLFKDDTTRSMRMIRQSFSASLDSMFASLYNELRVDGYWSVSPARVRGQYRRVAWLLLVLVCPAAFLFQVLASQLVTQDLFFSPVALAPWGVLGLVLIALLYLARVLPRKTRAGAEATARWNAFRRYLEQIEKYTNVANARNQFETYLPYAVAFGIERTWVEKFAAVDTPAPAWYITTGTGSPTHSDTHASKPAPLPAASSGGSASGMGGTVAGTPAPSLDSAARGAFTSLNSVSASFFSMLNTTATTFVASSSGYAPSHTSSRSGSSSSSSWSSSSSSSSHSSFSGGGSSGGGGGGGGHSGFG